MTILLEKQYTISTATLGKILEVLEIHAEDDEGAAEALRVLEHEVANNGD